MTASPVLRASAVALALTVVRSAHAEEIVRPRDAPLVGELAVLPPIPEEYLVYDDAGFAVAYHPAARERVRAVLPLLGAMRDELRTLLGVEVLSRVELRVGALPLELERLAPSLPEPQSSLGGLSFGDRSLVVIASQGGIDLDFEGSVRHHLAHLALDEASITLQGKPDSPRGPPDVPAWFHEGFAVHFAGERLGERAQLLEVSVLGGDPPSLGRLGRTRPGSEQSAYAADFVRFAAEGEAVFPSLVSGLRAGLPFDHALETAFGSEKSSIDDAWRRDMGQRYATIPALVLGLFLFVVVWIASALRKRRARRALESEAGFGADADPAPSARRPIGLLIRRNRPKAVPASNPEPGTTHPPEVPRIEHDGDWHTLH